MASSSAETDPATYFGFCTVEGFKDFLAYVLSCAPDLFPEDDWRPPDEQMNVDRAFTGLRYGLVVTARELGESKALISCRQLVDEAKAHYAAKRDHDGQIKLEELTALLDTLPKAKPRQ
jgi:hypothetical protein